MNRSLKLSMLMALALGSSQVMALDLGQIQVKSALGQPLLAEIPLHAADPRELQNLTVQLASSEEFARAGVMGGRTAIPLNFSVAHNGSGQSVIRITSSVAVEDPFLDLLIEVNGHAGRSVREFAILLDPPGTVADPMMAAIATAPAAAPARTVETAVTTAPPRQPRVAATPRTTAAAKPAGDAQFGPVARGQTLSAIARSAAPSGVDVHQMLLALKQANPDAFYRDNINALKSGVVLRIPTATEAQAMAVAAAVAEVARQNSDWVAGGTVKAATVADSATRTAASSAPSNTASDSGDRLALVQAKESDGPHAGGAGSSNKGGNSAAGIRQDLLRTQESIASLQQQSNDLKTQLKDLSDINSKNEHLLSLKDSEIAELQSKLAAARQATASPLAAATSVADTAAAPLAAASSAASTPQATAALSDLQATPAAETVAGMTPVAAASTALEATSAVAASTVPAAVAAASTSAPAKPVVAPVVTPAPATAVEQPWYMQTWAWAAGAGAILVLVLLALLGRRRKTAVRLPKSPSSLADRFSTSLPAADHDQAGDEDVDQEELLDQLAEHPDDVGLHLELVTLYYSRRDIEHFEAAAEAMHAHISDPEQDEWQDVMHMGEDLVPGHPLFDHHVVLPPSDETEARREFDIDDYSHDSDVPAAVSPPPPLPKKVSEYAFNFDLSAPGNSVASDKAVVTPLEDAMHETPAATPVEAASSWHFDEHESARMADSHGHDVTEFNDDPIDTKLDLARAYVDMGDADGARAMLGEVLSEGSQMQKDVANRLLETLH